LRRVALQSIVTPEAAALLSLNRVDHHRKLGSASGATIGFSDADKKLSKTLTNLRSAGCSGKLCVICWNCNKAQSLVE
jgi:hypothetical protein